MVDPLGPPYSYGLNFTHGYLPVARIFGKSERSEFLGVVIIITGVFGWDPCSCAEKCVSYKNA